MIRRAAAILVALELFGCSTEPQDPFEVVISGVVHSTGYSTANQRYECYYLLRLTASGGSPGDFARWDTGRTTFSYGDGGLDDLPNVYDFWGTERIGYQEKLEAERVAWHPTAAFSLYHEIYFTMPDGSRVTRSYSLPC